MTPTTTVNNSPTSTEPVIADATFSHCRLVTLAVAIIAVVVGVYYFSCKAKSSDPPITYIEDDRITGIVFYMNTIGVVFVNIDSGVKLKQCETTFGGKDRADMLKKQFESLSKTNELFIIEDDPKGYNPTEAIATAKKVIGECLDVLGIRGSFKDWYVWKRSDVNMPDDKMDIEMWSEVTKVSTLTGLENSKLLFVCKIGDKMCVFVEEKHLKVIAVDGYYKLRESDFSKIKDKISRRNIGHA